MSNREGGASEKDGTGARRCAGLWTALAMSVALVAPAAAQTAADHLDPALGGATPVDAASILIRDPSAAARIATETEAALAPTTALEVAIADAMPGGAAWSQVYERRGFAPIWLNETAGGAIDWAKADALLAGAYGVEAHALPLAPYELDALAARLGAARGGVSVEDAAALELDLTRIYLRLGRDLSSGALEPSTIRTEMDVAPPRPQPILLLASAASWRAEETASALDALAPRTNDYRALMTLYAELLAQRAAGGDVAALVPSDQTLRPLDQGPRVAALRNRLKYLGFLPNEAADLIDPATGEVVFGPMTEMAVREFQTHRGLDVDGVVGAATFGALNQTLDDRIALVAVNLERARWYNIDHGAGRYVVVNIPAFHAKLFENHQIIFETDVVVGQRVHQTPEFSDEMTHVVVNPTWNVPYSIATEEMLPQLRDNPGALQSRNFDVLDQHGYRVDPWSVDWWSLSKGYFPYRLRQGPGPGNALGNVKFIFPNHHAVYMHDTPSRHLFRENSRAFSHGCVRVADPEGFAEVLLGAQRSDPLAYFYQLRDRRSEVFVELQQPVPVHLTYRTVWVEADGEIEIREDIYGRDAAIVEALRGLGLSV